MFSIIFDTHLSGVYIVACLIIWCGRHLAFKLHIVWRGKTPTFYSANICNFVHMRLFMARK